MVLLISKLSEVFKSGATGLQKGKLKAKLILEFCPDEPVSHSPELPQDEYLN